MRLPWIRNSPHDYGRQEARGSSEAMTAAPTGFMSGGRFQSRTPPCIAISASEEAILITTDRGLYRTVDRGESWTLMIGGLPAHLEAGPLVRDPLDPATVYAGFSLIPYAELWRRAADRDSAFARVSLTSLAGAVVFLVILALGAVVPLRCLGSYYRASARSAPPARNDRNRSIGKTLP